MIRRRLVGAIVAGTALVATPVAAFADPGDWNWHHHNHCQTVRGSQLTLTNQDNGETFCVRRGTTVNVLLRSSSHGQVNSQSFTSVQDRGHALRPRVRNWLTVRGLTMASYDAVHRGTDTLSSYRAVCAPSQDHPTCHSLQAWSVTIDVR